MELHQKLELLMREKGVNQNDLSNYLGCTRQSVSLYVRGDRKPDYIIINKLADFFNVSTDYLFDRTEVRTTQADLRGAADYTGLSPEAVEILSQNKEKSKLISLLITEEFDGVFNFIDELEDLLTNLETNSGILLSDKWSGQQFATFREFEKMKCMIERYRGIEWIEKLLDHFDHRKTECEQYQMYKKLYSYDKDGD